MTRRSAWLAALLVATTSGCAAAAASRARQQHLQQELEAYQYPQPMDEVWSAVRRLLAGLDLQLAGQDAAAAGQELSMITRMTSVARETRVDPDGSRLLETDFSNGGVRYRASAWPGAHGVHVRFTRITASENDHGHDGRTDVDPQLELALMQELAPAAAAAIDSGGAAPAPPAPERPVAPPAPPREKLPAIPNVEET